MPIAAIASRAARALATLLLAALGGAALVQMAPGGDPEEFDLRLSAESRAALENARNAERSGYLGRLLRGDAGMSRVFGKPVGPLIAERFPRTAATVGAGLAAGWALALVLASAAALSRGAAPAAGAIALSGVLLSCPSAVLAVLCLLAGLPPSAAIAAVVFPRVFSHAHGQFRHVGAQEHVTMARALGMREARIFWRHVAPGGLPPLIALAGVSITIAAGAAIPVEAMADSPGLGHLAWRGAVGRDVPLLVATTLLLAAITIGANLASELALLRGRERRA